MRLAVFHLLCAICAAGLAGCAAAEAASSKSGRSPVIYCTDLFHPHDDPDDHFDLACLYALDGIELKAVILDQGAKQLQKPGRIPVSQMNRICGKAVPTAIGLAEPFRCPEDAGSDQDRRFQHGVETIIDILGSVPGKVDVITVGSVRDLMAAYNRRPQLLKDKIGRVLAFIGEASDPDFQEYNVGLDPHAYVRLMRSELPLYWVPCFDGGLWQNHGRASYWKARHEAVLAGVGRPVMNYFIYALTHQEGDPLAFLEEPVDPAMKSAVLDQSRNLWCTAVFTWLTDRLIVNTGSGFAVMPKAEAAGRGPIFTFEPVAVQVSDTAVVTEVERGGRLLRRFRVLDSENYAQAMTEVTAALLRRLGTGM